MIGDFAPVLWALVIFQAKHFLVDFVIAPRHGLNGGERYFLPARLMHALLHSVGSFPAILLLGGWNPVLALVLAAEFVLVYHLIWGRNRLSARVPSFAPSLGGAEQFLHQLFYIAAVALLV